MRIAVIGGSFNPVHIGHLALADDVRCAFGYDRILLIPAYAPPHKELSGGAEVHDRLAMLRLACEGAPWLTVDPCEVEREGVSWTIETLEYLLDRYPDLDGPPGLVIGADLVSGFTGWRRASDIARLARIILARRPSCGSEQPVKDDEFPYPCLRLDNPPLAVSSSGIRERIRSGKSWRYLVPDPVYRYIEGHGLYDTRKT